MTDFVRKSRLVKPHHASLFLSLHFDACGSTRGTQDPKTNYGMHQPLPRSYWTWKVHVRSKKVLRPARLARTFRGANGREQNPFRLFGWLVGGLAGLVGFSHPREFEGRGPS